MGTFLTFGKLALGYEDSFGKVLAGSTGKGARTLWQEAGASGAKGTKRIANFVNNMDKEVLRFDSKMSLSDDVFDKKTLKAIRKSGKNNKTFYEKFINLVESKPSKEKIATFLSENGITEVKESRGFFKSIKGFFTGDKAKMIKADDIAATAAEKIPKALAKDAEKLTTGSIKSAKGFKGIFKALKGKGGTIGIALTLGFEAFAIGKAFIVGEGKDEYGRSKGGHVKEGLKQVGRSGFNVSGFTAGAAAGAVIGSVLPIAGTGIGAIVGGLCGFVGGMIGGSIGDKIGVKVFGKSAIDKIEEAEEAKEAELKQQRLDHASQVKNSIISAKEASDAKERAAELQQQRLDHASQIRNLNTVM